MKQRPGFILFTVVILLLLLTIITLTAMQTGVLENRLSRNRHESEMAFLNGENVASKVSACFSGKTNDMCRKSLFSWSPNAQDKTLESMFSDRPQVYRLTNDQVYHYLVPHPKPRMIFPLPSMENAKQTKESLLPALATDIPIAIWRDSPNKASNPDQKITTDFLKNSCPAMSTCITNTFYLPRGYTLLAGGNIKLDKSNSDSNNPGNAQDNANPGQTNPGGAPDPTQGSNPSTLNLKAYPWLAAFSPMNHRFDFPTLAALHLAANEPASSSPAATTSQAAGSATGGAGSTTGNRGTASTSKGQDTGQSAPQSSSPGIIGSIHAQKDIEDLGNMVVEGFGTAGGKINQTKQIQLKTWDKGNCKDCFVDLDTTLEPKTFKKQIDNYVNLLKNDKAYHEPCPFGESGEQSGDAPSTNPSIAAQDTNAGQGQGVKSLDLGGAIYYCDGDVTIAADVDPKNGTIVATGDIVVEAFPDSSGFCPADQPIVGQWVDAIISVAYLVKASLPLIQDAANLLATTMASGAAGVAATPVTTAAGAAAGVAAAPATAAAGAAAGAAAAPVAGAAVAGTAGAAAVGTTGAVAGTAVPVAGNVAGATAGAATGAAAGAATGAAAGAVAAPVTGAAGAATGAVAAPVAGAAVGAAAPLASAAVGAATSGLQWIQDGAQAFKAGTATLSELCSLGRSLLTSLQQKNNPRNKQSQNQRNADGTPASDTLNLIAAGNITLRRNIFGTLTAAGDIAVADNISIVYPQAPEKAQLAAWRRDYHLQDQKP